MDYESEVQRRMSVLRLETVSLYSLWILICVCGIGVTIEDSERCIIDGMSDQPVFKNEFCGITNNDIHIMCPRKKLIVLSSLQFALKTSDQTCTNRVLASGDSFCCHAQDIDVVYNGDCLLNMWYPEDREHYKIFMETFLKTCNNTSKCVLNAQMFKSLQRHIPSTRHYSSYFQIVHQCITAPTDVVNICSPQTKIGRHIHVRGDTSSRDIVTKPCSCHVKSTGDGNVTVKAVDVRTSNNELVLKSDNYVQQLPQDKMPMFGFNEIFTDNELDIVWRKNLSRDVGNLWLQVSGTNGENINMTCEDVRPVMTTTEKVHYRVTIKPTMNIQVVGGTERSKPTPKAPTRSPSVPVNAGNDWEDYEELWPIIYAAAGAFLTMVPIFGIVCGVLICRMGSRPSPRPVMRQRREDPGQYNGQYNSEYLQPQSYTDRESAIYDTLKSRMSRIQEDDQRSDNASGFIHVQQRVTNPTPIPTSGPGQKNDTASSSLLSTTLGASYVVSEAESFPENSAPNTWEHQPTTIQIRGTNSNTYQNGQRSDSYLEPDYCEESNQLIASGYGPNTRSYFVLEGDSH